MNLICALISLGGLSMLAPMAQAQSHPTAELGRQIKKMYGYSVQEFELGINPSTARYDAARNCTLLRTFFDASMLKERNGAKKCEFDHSRFPPNIAGTPVEQLVNENNDTPPVPFIQSIKVSGNEAQVDILFGISDAPTDKGPDTRANQGRVIFFLKDLPQGWRIVNKLSFRRWPLKLDGENSDCKLASLDYQFALLPRGATDLAPLPPACQRLMRPPTSKPSPE